MSLMVAPGIFLSLRCRKILTVLLVTDYYEGGRGMRYFARIRPELIQFLPSCIPHQLDAITRATADVISTNSPLSLGLVYEQIYSRSVKHVA
jgi:hypothetical protein